jgi:phosphomannomutase
VLFQAAAPYEASLERHFKAVRPRKIVCGCPSPLVRRTVERVLKTVAPECDVISLPLPVRLRDPAFRRDADILRLSTAVRESQAAFGILIDDDAARCGFVDERGRYISPAAIARLVVLPLVARQQGSAVLLEPAALAEIRTLVEALGGRGVSCPDNSGQIVTAMSNPGTLYAGGDSGRHWFAEEFPISDALVTLAKVLAATSHADVPLSELATG